MRLCAIGLRGIPDVMGGIETHCAQLYPHMVGIDDALQVVVLGRSGYVKPARLGRIEIRTVWAPRQKFLETLIHTPLALLYARLFVHPDVVHLHGIGPGFFTPLSRLLGFRTVATHHAADYERPKWKGLGRSFLKTGEYMLAQFANRIICVNDTITQSLKARYPRTRRRATTIHNGAPAPLAVTLTDASSVLSELGLAKDQYILAVGRLDATKGFHDLVEAFERARPTGLKLVIAGAAHTDDPYSKALLAKGAEAVAFVGLQSSQRLKVLYENAAVFVHPSYMEGFALVILEALAADAPIILSDITANLEFGLDPHAYFPVGDVQALAAKLASGDFRAYRSRHRERILADCNWEEIARRHLIVFADCMR